jgi:hypothetical protein
MSHTAKYQISPYNSDIVFSPGDIPPDLRKLVEKGSQIERKRHPDYPIGIWFDNVRVHTIRCALSAQNLALPSSLEPVKSPMVRTLWIHDLPEVVSSLDIGYDTSAVVKEDEPAVAAKISENENAIAKKILKDSDYELFKQFELANTFLDGKASQPAAQPAAYGARIIDIGDAEMCFYHFLTAWLIHDSFDGRMPTERPYRFTMNRYSTYLANCERLANVLPKGLQSLYLDQLLGQITYISDRWALVEKQRPGLMPEIAKEHVAHLRRLLQDYPLEPKKGSKKP